MFFNKPTNVCFSEHDSCYSVETEIMAVSKSHFSFFPRFIPTPIQINIFINNKQ